MIKRIVAFIICSITLTQPNALFAERHRSMEGLFGGALGGALIGGIAGGGKGAGIGAGVGAGLGLLTGAAVDDKRRRERYREDEYEQPVVYRQQTVRRPQRDPHFYDNKLGREVFYFYDAQGNEQYYYLRRGQAIPLRNYQR